MRSKPESTGNKNAEPEALSRAERLSCLVDGELVGLTAQQALGELLGDDEACRWWHEIHWVGDALRSSDVAAEHIAGFQLRVLARLDREKAVPLREGIAQVGWRWRQWLMHHLFVPGVAVGAAMAVLAFMVLPQLRTAGMGPLLGERLEAQAPLPDHAPAATVRVVQDSSMHPYLQAHREFVPTRGVLPYSAPYLRTSATVQPSKRKQ